MDVVPGKKVTRLVASQGMTRVFEMEDNTWVTAQDGTVSWRNNNPGNLKFEFEGSADKTVHSTRSKEKALEQAQSRYGGVVDVMQAVQTPLAQSSQDAAVNVQNNTQQAQIQQQVAPDVQQAAGPSMTR